MKKILPVLLALLGLAAGAGAGIFLRPAPEPKVAEQDAAEEPADEGTAAEEGHFSAVPFSKPFVVPVFHDGATVAMIVISLAVEVDAEAAPEITAAEPKLRDAFLKVMFRHANSGGFDGDYTGGQKIDDLKAALRKALRTLLPDAPTGAVLITEIARQDS